MPLPTPLDRSNENHPITVCWHRSPCLKGTREKHRLETGISLPIIDCYNLLEPLIIDRKDIEICVRLGMEIVFEEFRY